MDLSIIIVNWNSAELLRKCLSSISLTSVAGAFEILVIDNASFDGSRELVSREFPHVMFIQSDENLGFAAGNNLGFDRCRGRYVLFLNPDTEIVGDAIEVMLEVMKSHGEAGVVGPKLINPDLSVQINCMRAFPTLFNEMFDSAWTRRILGRFNFAGAKPVICESDTPVSVEMLPGTCILLRREVFEEAGRFNENYFMYAEDVELNYRVRAVGWKNFYISRAAVIHHGGHSSAQQNESFFSTVIMRESVWQFLQTAHGRLYATAYRATTGIAAIGRICLLAIWQLLPVSRSTRNDAARSSRKWVKVLRWSFGREAWACGYRPAIRKDGVLAA